MGYLGEKKACPKANVNKKQRLNNYNGFNSAKSDKREKTLWKWFSLYIRLRDCPDDSLGFVRCITCNRAFHYKDVDCGHYISRRWKATKYREDNNYAQCVHCNRHLSGNLDEYAKVLGDEKVSELKALSRQPSKKMLLCDVESKIAYYKQKVKDEAFRVGIDI